MNHSGSKRSAIRRCVAIGVAASSLLATLVVIPWTAARPAPPTSQPPSGKSAGERPEARRHGPPASAPTTTPTPLEFPPTVSERDVQRLRLAEISYGREDPKLRIRFTSPRGSKRINELVATKLKEQGALTPELKRTLADGKPLEQLREIVAATGMEFADRIDIRDDPYVFRVFRKTVLRYVTDGCVRSGCHGGETARGMRLPALARDQDGAAYSSFLVLDAITVDGEPLLNRNDANRSVLLDFLLPPAKGRKEHPAVRGPNGRIPVLCTTEQAREYIEIRDWISALKSPRPNYALEYKYPDWLTPPKPVPASQPAAPPLAPKK